MHEGYPTGWRVPRSQVPSIEAPGGFDPADHADEVLERRGHSVPGAIAAA